MSTVTLNIDKVIETFPLTVKIAIPPENPQIQGFIKVDAKVRTKPEVSALADSELTDEEMLREIAVNIHGLGGANGAVMGEDAFREVLTGKFSMWLLPAITQGYFGQYGEARRGNSKRPR